MTQGNSVGTLRVFLQLRLANQMRCTKLLAEALARIEEARTAQATSLGKDLAQEWQLRIAGPPMKGEEGRRRYTEPASLPSYT